MQFSNIWSNVIRVWSTFLTYAGKMVIKVICDVLGIQLLDRVVELLLSLGHTGVAVFTADLSVFHIALEWLTLS